MSDNEVNGMHEWLQTPPGRYLLGWESQQFDQAVADIFGYHALQLGLAPLDALAANRMPHRWLATATQGAGQGVVRAPEAPALALVTDFAALPFSASSLDLLAMPHTLELSADPHATLHEVERVLVPEGRVVICGFNPASLWGLRQRRARLCQRLGLGLGLGDLFLPEAGEFIGYWRLRDWLRLLGFEVEVVKFGAYRPAVVRAQWLKSFEWMDGAGARWWPIFGAVYFVVAVKRVRGMRLMSPAWKTTPARGIAPVSVATRAHGTSADGQNGL